MQYDQFGQSAVSFTEMFVDRTREFFVQFMLSTKKYDTEDIYPDMKYNNKCLIIIGDTPITDVTRFFNNFITREQPNQTVFISMDDMDSFDDTMIETEHAQIQLPSFQQLNTLGPALLNKVMESKLR